MIIRIPEKCSKELRKGRLIISRLRSLSHRVIAPQRSNDRVVALQKEIDLEEIIRNKILNSKS
jgi:hypothetical protein